jgi:hypothetical protein
MEREDITWTLHLPVMFDVNWIDRFNRDFHGSYYQEHGTNKLPN